MTNLMKLAVALGMVTSLTSCKDGEGFGALEEASAFLDEAGPLITKFEDTFELGVDDSLRLNFNDEKIGNDFKMAYTCTFVTVIDGTQGGNRDCDELPDGPTTKFNKETGQLNWGPFNEKGTFEIFIAGSNDLGADVSTVSVIIGEPQTPKLDSMFDQVVPAEIPFTFKASNTRDEDDANTTYDCSYDLIIDNTVDEGKSCQLLEGDPAIKFDVDTGIFVWTPPVAAEGDYEFKIIATNDFGTDEALFVVSVGESGEKKVRLSFIRDQYVYSGETLTLDANNQITGDDEGVEYTCYYDAVIDGVVGASLSCDLLPGEPTQKFNTITGQLTWTPSLSQQTEIEVKILGQKLGDSDEQLFLVSFSTQKFGEVGNSAITFDPTSWDFGSVSLGESSTSKDITLTNGATSDIYIGSIGMSNSEFVVNWSSCPSPPSVLASQASCVVNVSYTPVTAAQLGAFLNVKFGKTEATKLEFSSVLGLSGRGVGSLNFDGLQSITNVTHNSLKLNWNETAQAASFLIFRIDGTSLIYLETILNTGGTLTERTISNLTPNTSYTYRVRATDFVGVVDNNTNDVTTSTDPNQAPAVADGPSPYNTYTGTVAADVDFNDNYSGNDLDRDGDIITYTCVYDNDIDGAVADGASTCASLVNIDATNPTFNQFSGIFSGWKPAGGDLGQEFEFKVTGSDTYGASSNKVFSTTVASGAPLITAASNLVFPSSYYITSDTLAIDFDNIRFTPNGDTDMTYSCAFERLAASAAASSDCSNLPGQYSLDTSSGILSWTPGVTRVGGFAITVTGTNLVGNHSRTFNVAVDSAKDFSNRIHHLDARFVDLTGSGVNGGSFTTSWLDLLTDEPDATLYNFDTSSAWTGAGTSSSPASLTFDGTDDYVEVNSSVKDETYVRFEAWVYPGANDREKVIFSYGNNTENGMILTSRRLWLGQGNDLYSSTILADSPYVYYRMENIENGTAADSSGNVRNGVVTNPANVSQDVDDATFDLSSNGALIEGAYIQPNIAVGAEHGSSIDASGDFSISAWFYYPFLQVVPVLVT
ncbi:MAG: hypothetical protein HRU19_27650 [Pseudobacteriovorax sp.]|nr:hypothetical protein [Pseudobacteriovorax sp.]